MKVTGVTTFEEKVIIQMEKCCSCVVVGLLSEFGAADVEKISLFSCQILKLATRKL